MSFDGSGVPREVTVGAVGTGVDEMAPGVVAGGHSEQRIICELLSGKQDLINFGVSLCTLNYFSVPFEFGLAIVVVISMSSVVHRVAFNGTKH